MVDNLNDLSTNSGQLRGIKAHFCTTRLPERVQPNLNTDQIGTWRNSEPSGSIRREGGKALSSCRHELFFHLHVGRGTKIGNPVLTKMGGVQILGVPYQFREEFRARESARLDLVGRQ